MPPTPAKPANHSPLPWTVEFDPHTLELSECFAVKDADKRVVCITFGATEADRAHADRIVRCVNTHDDLVAACKWIGKYVLTAKDGGAAWCAVRDRPGAQKWIKTLEAALAKAEK